MKQTARSTLHKILSFFIKKLFHQGCMKRKPNLQHQWPKPFPKRNKTLQKKKNLEETETATYKNKIEKVNITNYKIQTFQLVKHDAV